MKLTWSSWNWSYISHVLGSMTDNPSSFPLVIHYSIQNGDTSTKPNISYYNIMYRLESYVVYPLNMIVTPKATSIRGKNVPLIAG